MWLPFAAEILTRLGCNCERVEDCGAPRRCVDLEPVEMVGRYGYLGQLGQEGGWIGRSLSMYRPSASLSL